MSETSAGASPKTETFKHEQLTTREHMDADKHWIGESLPAPSTAETRPSGTITGPGVSPYPARADHTHDNRQTFAVYNTGNLSFTHGQERYFDNLTFIYGTNILNAGSTQLLIFPSAGVWQVSTLWQLNNPTPNAGGWVQYYHAYNNVTYKPTVYLGPCHNTSGIGYFYMTSTHHIHYSAVDATCNVQFSAYNASGGTANISLGLLQVTRLSSWY